MSARPTYAELHPKKKKVLDNRKGKLTSTRFVNDEKSIQECPKCHVNIQKVKGCNFIRCSQCKAEWCWQCGDTKDECTDKSHNSH